VSTWYTTKKVPNTLLTDW